MTIDHVGLCVSDLGRAKTFYETALAPLGIAVLFEVTSEQSGGGAHVGFGMGGQAFFWIDTGEQPSRGAHVAFTAGSRALVDSFHRAALAAGGVDNGGPGLRPHYHPDYYGAFVLDLDGNNVEAVCHAPPPVIGPPDRPA